MTLAELRSQYGWTQGRLAAALGVTQPFLSQVEAGGKPLPIQRAAEAVEAMGVPVDDRSSVVGDLLVTHARMAASAPSAASAAVGGS